MASSVDPWIKEFNEASKLADDITVMISERGSLPPSGPETQRHTSAIRRKITILGTRLDSLESLLSKHPSTQPKMQKELHKRQDMVANLKSKANQMASTLNMSNFARREDLLGPSKRSVDEIDRTSGLDNYGIVHLQRQVMKEQDESLVKLEETVISTKHIALAVNEELDLHTRLIDDLDQHVDSTNSRLQVLAPCSYCRHALTQACKSEIIKRVQQRLAVFNRRVKRSCSCKCMLLSVGAIVILAAIAFILIKYL